MSILRCSNCRSWIIPVDGKMLCPKCDSGEVHRIGKEYERKFVERMDREVKKV